MGVAVSGCSGDRGRARDGAIATLVTSRENAEECFERFVRAYRDDQDFTEYLATLDSEACGSAEILNKTDAELERFRYYRDRWLPFRPGGRPGTWYTSSTQSGNTVEVAVTTLGRGDGSSNDNFPVLEFTAVCWTLLVDLESRSTEAVDEGTCHEALLVHHTEVVDWDDALDKYEENRAS